MNIHTDDPRFRQILTNALIGRNVVIEVEVADRSTYETGLLILADDDGVHVRVHSVTKIIPFDYILSIEDKGLAR